ncbi:hypothetical protein PFISCL1PPCAC_17157, partial [Pristionchus fissidentatus]
AMMSLICLIVLVAASSNVNCYNVTLYSKADWKGKTLDIVSESCENVPDWLLATDGGVSGVWTNYICVILYTNFNCTGSELIMRTDTLSHETFHLVGFDNRAKSVSSCKTNQDGTMTEYTPLFICALLTFGNFCFTVSRWRKKQPQFNPHLPLPPIPSCEEHIHGFIEPHSTNARFDK